MPARVWSSLQRAGSVCDDDDDDDGVDEIDVGLGRIEQLFFAPVFSLDISAWTRRIDDDRYLSVEFAAIGNNDGIQYWLRLG